MLRAVATTFTPLLTNARTIAFPIPVDAPVTKASLPTQRSIFWSLIKN